MYYTVTYVGNSMPIPKWVKKFRQPRTEIKAIGGRYYVYEVSSVWNAQLKRTRKVSGKVLGKITQEKGFIKRESYNKPAITLPVLSKEYGATVLFQELMSDSILQLQKLFPSEWQQIVVAAYARLVHQSPLKNIELHYDHSYYRISGIDDIFSLAK